MNKKADIWVSSVIYIALGVTLLAIVLAGTLPIINNMRDKNTILQTKEVMHKLDYTVREVLRDGPGSQRTATIKIEKGEFDIVNNKIEWKFNSKIEFSTPDAVIEEGNIKILTEKAGGQYKVTMTLDYNNAATLTSTLASLSGQYNLLIRNNGSGVIGIESVE